jgi:Neuraminidase (sialidase)
VSAAARRPGLLAGLAIAVLATAASAVPAAAAGHKSSSGGGGSSGFVNFTIAENPPTSCPGSGACWNYAAEPQIRADAAGNFYGSTENGLGGGTVAVKSTDGGLHYTTLTSPNGVSSSNTTGFAPGGGDTDLATATAKNAGGLYNVYVASLSLANVDVSTSQDGGQTWSLNPLAATISGDDREWIAAEGAAKVCISYHDVATFNLDVNCSYDAGTTFTQLGEAFDSNHLWLAQNNESGNLAIDPSSHTVYQTFSGIASSSEVACGTAGTCGYHAVYMAVSTDGGKTFTDHPVYTNPDPAAGYGHQFSNVSVDQAGNVYSVFCDNHNVYLSYSTDHGTTWSKPVTVNQGQAKTAIFPWSVAGAPGHVDVVYYGSSYYDGTTVPDNYPMTAAWYAYFAQDLDVLGGSAFTQAAATPIVHYGGVCEGGISCTGNRDLYDDFGVAADPLTGLASIIYSDDQYASDANDVPSSICSPSDTDTANCDHTAIATQTGGSGIYSTTTTNKKR